MDSTDTNGLQDNIYMIAGLFKARMLYMGLSSIYISDELNPDAIDTRFTIRAFGDPMEKNLWLKKVNNNILVLATTKDLYEISGTFETLPDGTFDVTITPIGKPILLCPTEQQLLMAEFSTLRRMDLSHTRHQFTKCLSSTSTFVPR